MYLSISIFFGNVLAMEYPPCSDDTANATNGWWNVLRRNAKSVD